jgi:hypothetical protein
MLLLTSETLQKAAIKTVVRGWLVVQGGCEAVAERFRDAATEIRAETERQKTLPSQTESEPHASH